MKPLQISNEGLLRFSASGLAATLMTAIYVFYIFSVSSNYITTLIILFVAFLYSAWFLFYTIGQKRVYLPTIFVLIYFTWNYIFTAVYQVSRGSMPWNIVTYDDVTMNTAALSIVLFLVFFSVGQAVTSEQHKFRAKILILTTEFHSRKAIIILLTIVTTLSGALVIYLLGPESFLGSRGNLGVTMSRMELTEVGLLIGLPRTALITVLTLLLYLLYRERKFRHWRKRRYTVFMFIVFLPVFLTINNPGSLPRSAFFGTILLLIFMYIPFRSVPSRFGFVIVYCFTLMTAFPVAQAINRQAEFKFNIEMPEITEYLMHGDFDGFETTLNTVVYARQHNHTMGRQIGSAFLFFVPRSIWPEKAKKTAVVTGDALGYDYTNLSTPIVGELFIDWWLFGVVIGAFLIGHVFRRLDYFYAAAIEIDGLTLHRILIANVSISTIMLLRGALLGTIPVIIGVLMIYVILKWPMIVRLISPTNTVVARAK